MRFEELYEGISDVVFHYTSFMSFMDMVKSNEIRLSPVHGYEKEINRKFKYFLSTTRSRIGSYHVNRNSGVLIVLDGRKIGRTFSAAPVDYWERTQGDEMEDRVFSQSQTMPLDQYAVRVDILVEPQVLEDDRFLDKLDSLRNEPFEINVYDDRKEWVYGSKNSRYNYKNGRRSTNFQYLMKKRYS